MAVGCGARYGVVHVLHACGMAMVTDKQMPKSELERTVLVSSIALRGESYPPRLARVRIAIYLPCDDGGSTAHCSKSRPPPPV